MMCKIGQHDAVFNHVMLISSYMLDSLLKIDKRWRDNYLGYWGKSSLFFSNVRGLTGISLVVFRQSLAIQTLVLFCYDLWSRLSGRLTNCPSQNYCTQPVNFIIQKESDFLIKTYELWIITNPKSIEWLINFQNLLELKHTTVSCDRKAQERNDKK